MFEGELLIGGLKLFAKATAEGLATLDLWWLESSVGRSGVE